MGRVGENACLLLCSYTSATLRFAYMAGGEGGGFMEFSGGGICIQQVAGKKRRRIYVDGWKDGEVRVVVDL